MRSAHLLLSAALVLPVALPAQRPLRAAAQPQVVPTGVARMRGGAPVESAEIAQQHAWGVPPPQPPPPAQLASLALSLGLTVQAQPFFLGPAHLAQPDRAYLAFWTADVVSPNFPYAEFKNLNGPLSVTNPFRGVEIVVTPSEPGEQYLAACQVWPSSGSYTIRNKDAASTTTLTGSASLHLVITAVEQQEVHVTITGLSSYGVWVFQGCEFTKVA